MSVFSEAVAEAIAGGVLPLPEEVVRRSRDALIDTWGCALAAARGPVADSVEAALGAVGRGAAAIGRSSNLPPLEAALLNGTVAHALDFDDTLLCARSHVSSHLLPVIISTAAITDRTGPEAMTAYALGVEVEARVGRLLEMRSTLPRGWHPTGVLGTLGSTVTAAAMLGLDARDSATALGIAASMAAGARLNIGTMTKPLHSGLAARNGVLAAVLARQGLSAAAEAWDAPQWGVLTELTDRELDFAGAVDGLGSRWQVAGELGLALKPNPSCARTHAGIESARQLAARLAALGDTPTRVEVHVTTATERMLRYPRPRTALEAKFSMHFCVAAALRGPVGICTFTPEQIGDPKTRRLIGLVHLIADRPPEDDDAALVRVHTANGRILEQEVTRALGWPERWPSEDDVRAKFLDCAEAGGFTAGDQMYRVLSTLPASASIRSTIERTVALERPV